MKKLAFLLMILLTASFVAAVDNCSDDDGGINFAQQGIVSKFVLEPETVYETETLNFSDGLKVLSSDAATLKVHHQVVNVSVGPEFEIQYGVFEILKINFFGVDNANNSIVIQLVEAEDFCVGPDELVEFYCDPDHPGYVTDINEHCSQGCVNGACIQDPGIYNCGDRHCSMLERHITDLCRQMGTCPPSVVGYCPKDCSVCPPAQECEEGGYPLLTSFYQGGHIGGCPYYSCCGDLVCTFTEKESRGCPQDCHIGVPEFNGLAVLAVLVAVGMVLFFVMRQKK